LLSRKKEKEKFVLSACFLSFLTNVGNAAGRKARNSPTVHKSKATKENKSSDVPLKVLWRQCWQDVYSQKNIKTKKILGEI
jgi:hypothetical protein